MKGKISSHKTARPQKAKAAAGAEKKPSPIRPRRRPAKAKSAEKMAQEEKRMGLFNLKPPKGAHKKKKLLGRGSSSGHGKTSTRGSKGQTSRAGRHFYLGFEGGQSPLIRRMPKRGFSNAAFRKEFQIINLGDLERIKEPRISLALLEEKGLIKDKDKPVKVLGKGDIKNAVTVEAHAFSKRAAEEIQRTGGKIEIVNV